MRSRHRLLFPGPCHVDDATSGEKGHESHRRTRDEWHDFTGYRGDCVQGAWRRLFAGPQEVHAGTTSLELVDLEQGLIDQIRRVNLFNLLYHCIWILNSVAEDEGE